MSTDSLDQARENIDAEILALEERIRALRSQRNALTLIYRLLPPEVMTQIFLWVQRLYIGGPAWSYIEYGTQAKSLPKWIRVTHVSQHWRNIALNSKALYSTIITHNINYSQNMLKLSGGLALTLVDTIDRRTRTQWTSQEALQEMILPLLPHVRSLSLDQHSEGFLLPHLEKSNMHLEELVVVGWHTSCRSMFSRSLRCLELSDFSSESFKWLSSLSGLVELTLMPMGPGTWTSMDTLLGILDGMPRLTFLELGSVVKSPTAQRASPASPRLECLKLRDLSVPVISELLCWLAFAPRFFIQVAIDENAEDWSPLFIQLSRHLRTSSMAPRVVEVTWVGGEFEVQSPYLCLRFPTSHWHLPSAWVKGVEALQLGDIALTVHSFIDIGDWKNSPWHDVGTLRRLTLMYDETSLAFLEHLVHATYEESSGYIPFSSLEELSLTGLDYGRDLESNTYDVLTERVERGIKLRKLTLVGCKISEDSIEELLKVVDVVEQRQVE